jgi:hypothetical protein
MNEIKGNDPKLDFYSYMWKLYHAETGHPIPDMNKFDLWLLNKFYGVNTFMGMAEEISFYRSDIILGQPHAYLTVARQDFNWFLVLLSEFGVNALDALCVRLTGGDVNPDRSNEFIVNCLEKLNNEDIVISDKTTCNLLF